MMTGVILVSTSSNGKFQENQELRVNAELKKICIICGVMEGNYTQKKGQIKHGQRKAVVCYHEKLLSSKSWKSILINFEEKAKQEE